MLEFYNFLLICFEGVVVCFPLDFNSSMGPKEKEE